MKSDVRSLAAVAQEEKHKLAVKLWTRIRKQMIDKAPDQLKLSYALSSASSVTLS